MENRRHSSWILDDLKYKTVVNICVLDMVLNFSKPILWIFLTFVYILKRKLPFFEKILRKCHNYFKYENLPDSVLFTSVHLCTSLIIKQLSLVAHILIDFLMWSHVLFSKKNVDKRTDGRMNRHTDKRTDGQMETDRQTSRHHQSISKNCVTILPKRHTKKKLSEQYMSIWNKHLLWYILIAYILCILVSATCTYNKDKQ